MWDETITLFKRVPGSTFEHLQHSLQRLVSFIDGQQLHRFIQKLCAGGANVKVEGEAIRENIKQIAMQIMSQEEHFEDVTLIVTEFLSYLEFGVLIACESSEERRSGAEFLFTPNAIETQGLLARHGKNKSEIGNQELQTLKIMAVRAAVEGLNSFSPSDFRLLDCLLGRIVKIWEKKENEQARDREEATKLYHFKGLEELDPDDDEAGVEEMFSEGKSAKEKASSKAKIDLQELGNSVSSLHEAIFSGKIPEGLDVSSLNREFSAAIKTSTNKVTLSHQDIESLVPPMILGLSDASKWLIRTPKSLFNFYKDENPTEVSKSVEMLSRLKLRLVDLVSRWPENDILRDAMEKVSEALRLPLRTPVNTVLAKLEGLHTTVHQWEQVASKEVSLQDYQASLIDLIVSWRKLELQTWPSLFSQEDQSCHQNASTWWFHIYKTVSAAKAVEERDIGPARIALADTLNSFMRQSTVGEFEDRLKLLEGMENHLEHDPSPHSQALRDTLRNVRKLHSQFTKAASEHIATQKVKLEKDMKEIILLASWKDTNINSLKESTRRSHYQLYKVVKKYRAVLATPVSAIAKALDLGKLEMGISVTANQNTIVILESDITTCADSIRDWGLRPARLVNISSTVFRMQQSYVPVAPSQSSFALVDQFSEHILQRAQELRDATPSKLTKENTTEVRRLQDAKRRSLNEGLKSLRQMGFKSNLSQKELSTQSSMENILALASSLECKSFEPRIDEIDSLLAATLENLSKTRGVLINIPPDVPVPDLVRGSRYFEHGISMTITQREALASYLRVFGRLQELIGHFLVFCQPQAPQENLNQRISRSISNPQALIQQLGWLQANIGLAETVVEAEAGFVGCDYTKFLTILSTWKEWAAKSTESLSQCPKTFPGIVTNQVHLAIESIRQNLAELRTELETFGESNADLQHVTNYILPWIPSSEAHPVNGTSAHEYDESSVVAAVDGDIQRLCDTILALVQPEVPGPAPTNKEKIIQFEHTGLVAPRMATGCGIVVQKLETLGQALSRATTQADLNALQAVMRLVSPIIIQYERICYNDLSQRLDFHRAVCRLTHIMGNLIINLGTNGFCAPSEGSGGAGAAGQLESGTGLGDGEGEEDISKDIAPDEDLSELANQQEGESSKEKYDAEENAVENDDIDGISESGSEKSEREGDGDEDGEDDMVDEMGNVDDQGLDSLDKDFWDNPTEEPKDEVDADSKGGKDENAAPKQEKQKKEDKAEKSSENKAGEELQQDDVSEGVPEDESDAIEQHQADNMNEHVPEVERLDISDDLDIGETESIEEDNEDEGDMSGQEDDGLEKPTKDDTRVDTESEGETEEDKEMEDIEGAQDETLGEETDPRDSDEEHEEREGGELDTMEQEATDDPVEDALHESTMTANAQTSAAPTSQDMDVNDLGAGASDQNMESKDLEESAQDNTVPNAMDGQGDTGKAEYRPGQGQADPQSNERRLENGLKRLGDLLEKVHRTPMEILESEARNGPQDEIQGAEDAKQTQFEHVGEDDGKQTSQALGAATVEESHAIDESMVIDSAPDQTEQPGPGDDGDDTDAKIHEEKRTAAEEQTGFQETSEDLKDLPGAAPQTSKEDLEETMEVDVPRLAGDSKNEHVDAMELDEEDINDESQETQLAEATKLALPYASDAQSLWRLYENKTRILALSLTEQLRLILEPTLSTKLRGDYRTGKRLNMKRIIPYIASDYKKDKIWMRRTKPSKRQYQVMIALDDSKSMSESRCIELTFESIALVARALTHLEVGQISVVSFGETTKLVHPFEQQFTAQSGAAVFGGLTFAQTKTNMKSLVETSIKLFREARRSNQQSDLWQLELIISDGICEDHQEIQRLVRLAHFEKIVLIFVIIDATGGAMGGSGSGSGNKSSSILDMKEAVFVDQGDGKGSKLQVNRYMDTFPFNYYLIIRRIEDLPGMLSTALRQWFSQAAEAGS
ncbi:Midasin [Dactylella cylindrospora]|nr:Midasin [Dactylella cylindrospora]